MPGLPGLASCEVPAKNLAAHHGNYRRPKSTSTRRVPEQSAELMLKAAAVSSWHEPRTLDEEAFT